MLIVSLGVTAIRPRRHQLLDRLRGPRERAPVRVAVRLNCDQFTAQNAASETTRYEYAANAASPDPAVKVRSGYRLRRIFLPDSLNPDFARQKLVRHLPETPDVD